MKGTTTGHSDRPTPTKARPARKQHGIYLASVLLVIALLAMLLGAAVKVSEGTAANGSATSVHAALDAANSGLRYARARLAENYHWRGDGNGVMVNAPDLVVQEQDGNVTGIIKTPGRRFAQFRIRFNFQNGDNKPYETGVAAPGMNDPTTRGFNYRDDPYVSINNIDGMGSAPVYRADGSGASVTTSSPAPYTVPSATACIIVEGRAGPAMANLGPDNVNAVPIAGDHYSRKVVEAFFQATGGPTANAAVEAGGDMTFGLPAPGPSPSPTPVVSVMAKNGTTPAIRSHTGKVTVSGGGNASGYDYVSHNGDIYAPKGFKKGTHDPTVTVKSQDSSSGFYKLSWNQVKQASSSDPNLPAGTYIVEDGGSLVYYPVTYDEYQSDVKNNTLPQGKTLAGAQWSGTTTGSLPSDVSFGPTGTTDANGQPNYQLKINGNVYVSSATDSDSNNTIDGLAFEPAAGADSGSGSGGSGTVTNGSLTTAEQTHVQTLLNPISYTDLNTNGHHEIAWKVPVSAQVASGLPATSTSNNSEVGGLSTTRNLTPTGGSGSYFLRLLPISGDSNHAYFVLDDSVSDDSSYAFPNLTSSSYTMTDVVTALQDCESNSQDDTTTTTILNDILSGGNGQSMGSQASSTTVRAGDLSVQFPPSGSGKSAILTANGDITLGANAKGVGSITTQGSLNLVAPGTSISSNGSSTATPDASSVSLYAVGDINLSTLKQPLPLSSTSSSVDYQSFIENGVIYTQGHFNCSVGYSDSTGNSADKWGSFTLDGALVAYGANPAATGATPTKNGSVSIAAQAINLTYDPKYLVMMDTDPPPGPLTRTFYTQY